MARKRHSPHPPRKSETARKMSEILKEMMERLLRDPEVEPSAEAAHVALLFAHLAWNECVGLDCERQAGRDVWQTIEAEKPDLWDELKSRDIDAMVDELVEYKQAHYPDDRRRILTCGGTPHGTIRVEWLAPAAPGVDSKQQMELYGMVRMGLDKEAMRYLKKTRKLSKEEAAMEVARISIALGMYDAWPGPSPVPPRRTGTKRLRT
ncbi:MAG: hypothetical protein ACOY3P_19600 [Planctomycetota bacterium]